MDILSLPCIPMSKDKLRFSERLGFVYTLDVAGKSHDFPGDLKNRKTLELPGRCLGSGLVSSHLADLSEDLHRGLAKLQERVHEDAKKEKYVAFITLHDPLLLWVSPRDYYYVCRGQEPYRGEVLLQGIHIPPYIDIAQYPKLTPSTSFGDLVERTKIAIPKIIAAQTPYL